MSETRAWWVDSDPEHPLNAVPEPEPAPSSEPAGVADPVDPALPSGLVPPHIAEAVHVAESPLVTDSEREQALEVLRAWDAAHKAEEPAPAVTEES